MTKTIRAHHDADGITSAYFTSLGVKDSKIELWDGAFGDVTGLKKGDWMCDMRPNKDLKGLTVIDHHLPHMEEHEYELISADIPASLIAFNKFKDQIPKSEWWKLAIGMVGDGQPQLIPTEIFDECPQLIANTKTSSFLSYGKWKINYFPTYKLLSSQINALLRQSKFQDALNCMMYSKSPSDLLSNGAAIKAKIEVKQEYERIVKSAESVELNNLVVYVFSSPYRMTGYIASSIQGSMDGKSVMAINKKDGRGSLRGDLAYFWRDKLKPLDYLVIDGHPGFCGLTVKGDVDNLIGDLVRLYGV